MGLVFGFGGFLASTRYNSSGPRDTVLTQTSSKRRGVCSPGEGGRESPHGAWFSSPSAQSSLQQRAQGPSASYCPREAPPEAKVLLWRLEWRVLEKDRCFLHFCFKRWWFLKSMFLIPNLIAPIWPKSCAQLGDWCLSLWEYAGPVLMS